VLRWAWPRARVVPPADGAPAVVIGDPAGQRWTLVDGV
jgi:hypothetical protein